MDVSVIIVNFNTLELTKQCIDSVFEKTKDLSFEIILVDNASTDGSYNILNEDKRITFIPLNENVGFGNANNIGITRAAGKYLFFLNSDTYLLNNAIKEFYDFAERNDCETIGAIGCLLQKSDGSYCHSYAPFPSFSIEILKSLLLPWSSILGTSWNYLDKPKFTGSSMPVDYVTGADLFVRKSVVEKLGAFDSDFFMYYEESEMQYRWAKAGLVNYVISNPKIAHLEGCSFMQKKTVMRNVGKELLVYRSLFLYMKKTSSSVKYIFFRFCFAMVKLPFLFFASLRWQDRKEYMTLFLCS